MSSSRGHRGGRRESINTNFRKDRDRGKKKWKRNNSRSKRDLPAEEIESKDNRPPAHLKGREIGLWYARRNQGKRKKQDSNKPHGIVLLSEKKRKQIQVLLDSNIPLNFQIDNKNYEHVSSSNFKTKFMKILSGSVLDKIKDSTQLKRDETLDELYQMQFCDMQENEKYKKMHSLRKKLPAYKMREEITRIIEQNQVVVISGETGCGKTTQVGQFILDSYLERGDGSVCNIICTQPRRISAISIAERVAAERAEKLGDSVGFQIRLEHKLPRSKGSILFCTTGVILKMMEDNISLDKVSHLILDEVHERDVLTDILIALLKHVIVKRKDLKLILMSATLNAEKFASYFGIDSIIDIPGFTYEVTEYYLEDALLRTGFKFSNEKTTLKKWNKEFQGLIMPYIRNIEGNYPARVIRELMNPNSESLNLDLVLELLIDICEKEEDQGAVLVFLTGFGDINTLTKKMEESDKFLSWKYLIIPLHSQLPTVEQKYIFEPPPLGVRKIILSTNIAETSITINDVVFVIDCGKIKMSSYDLELNQQTLLPEWISLANANQRRGRAGRVKPGICYHLFSRARKASLQQYQKPEVLRKRLENNVLTIKILQLGKAHDFLQSLIDAPEPQAVELSIDLLKRLNALDEDENLTPLGFHLARLPLGPQMGKMCLLGAIFSCLDPILSIAASLEYKDPFMLSVGQDKVVDRNRLWLSNGVKSDHITIANALHQFNTVFNPRQFCYENSLSYPTMSLLQNMKRQFAQYLNDLNFLPNNDPQSPEFNINSKNTSLIKAIICAGLYPNVVINRQKWMDKRQRTKTFYTFDGDVVHLHPKSVLNGAEHFESPLFVYYLKIKSHADNMHDATMVHPLPLLFFGDKFAEHDDPNGVHSISVNQKLKFKCSESTSGIIKELRERLNWFLEYKVAHPKPVDWLVEEEVSTLRAIMELITYEDSGVIDLDAYEDYD